MKVSREFFQETVALFSHLYERQISAEEAEDIICNSLKILETLGSTRKCGDLNYENKTRTISV